MEGHKWDGVYSRGLTIVLCGLCIAVGYQSGKMDWQRRVDAANYSAGLSKQEAGLWRAMTFTFVDGVAYQAKRAQACEDNVTSQFDMRIK